MLAPRSLALAALCALTACSAPNAEPAGSPAGASVHVRFRLPADGVPAPLEVPFPTDLYLDASIGTIQASLGSWENLGVTSHAQTIDSAFKGLDGFGRSVGALFLVDAESPIDPATLVGGETVALVDVDATSPDRGAVIAAAAGYTEGPGTIAVHPDRSVLEAGRRYAAILTTGIRTLDGRSLGPPSELAAIAALPATQRLRPADVLYGDAMDVVAAAGFAPERLAAIAVFTTQSRHRLLRRMRDALVAGAFGPAPQLAMEAEASAPVPVARFGASAHTGWTATLDEWLGDAPKALGGGDLPGFPDVGLDPEVGTAHDAIGAVLNGSFVAPEFRRAFASTASPDDGTFELGADGLARVAKADQRIPITIVLPRTSPPPSGWPVVLFGHGTPTHRSYVMSVANELARAGMAVVAIDAPEHGLRTPHVSDEGSAFTGPYRGPDGMADEISYLGSTLASFGDLVNLARARDTRAQTILDYCQARRLIDSPTLDLSAAADEYGGVAPKLDANRVGWVGVSFGGINGMVLAAVEPDIDAYVLDVGGGAEYVTFGESPANLPQFDLVVPAQFGLPHAAEVRMSRYSPTLTVLQMIMDSTDPASFAFEATHPPAGPGPNLYVIQVHFDENVPNYGTELVAKAMGLPQIADSAVTVHGLDAIGAPVRGNVEGRTRAFLVQTQATHGRNLTSRRGSRTAATPFPREDESLEKRITYLPAPVVVRQPLIATQASMVRFLQSAWTDEAPVIDVAGMALWVDFDDDGWPDDEETTAGTDPFDPSSHPPGPPTHPVDVGF